MGPLGPEGVPGGVSGARFGHRRQHRSGWHGGRGYGRACGPGPHGRGGGAGSSRGWSCGLGGGPTVGSGQAPAWQARPGGYPQQISSFTLRGHQFHKWDTETWDGDQLVGQGEKAPTSMVHYKAVIEGMA